MPPIRIKTIQPEGDVADLHAGLNKLSFKIDPAERATGQLGDTTKSAIAEFQRASGLQETGNLDDATVDRLNVELGQRYFTTSKVRTAKIQDMLSRTGLQVDSAELASRRFGSSTQAAYVAYLRKNNLPENTPLNPDLVERLESDALAARLGTKTQIGQVQRTLLRALRIAKLDSQIDPAELKGKRLGDTTKAAIVAFQTKYNLDATGELNPATIAKIESVASSRPRPGKMLSVENAQNLAPITRNLRLNMTNKYVGNLQTTLAFLGFPINETEFKTSSFGATTRAAVIEFQKRYKLPVNGHVDAETKRLLNLQIANANPEAAGEAFARRLRGSVRDDLWRGRTGVKVQIWEKLVRGEGALLAERPTTTGGFYDIPYNPPLNPVNKQPKLPYHLKITVVDSTNAVLDSKVLFNPTAIAWVNFVQGDLPYRGNSEYSQRVAAIGKVIAPLGLLDLEETDDSQEITHVAVNTGLSNDDVMRVVISARVAQEIGAAGIDAAVIYAYVRQNLPPALPSDLLGSTMQWTLIDNVVDRVANGIVFLDAELQDQAFDNAIRENYIPVETAPNKAAILATFASLRESFVLEKPILIGNGNLKSLLDASSIDAAHYPAVSSAFLQHKTLGADFWADVRSRPNDFGGAAAIDDFEVTVSLGEITKNFSPVATHLKGVIEDPGNALAKAPRDFAKLGQADWEQLITDSGGTVPPGTDGADAAAQVANYAATLAAQSERLFPTVAFVSHVGRSGNAQLTKIPEIQQFVDDHPDFELGSSQIDAYAASNALALDSDVAGEIKVMARIQRITPNAETGSAVLNANVFSSADILKLGKERTVAELGNVGIEQKVALSIYSTAEFQYGQALNRLIDFRSEVNRATPRAIIPYTYTPEELSAFSGGIPNLEALFGPMDVSDVSDCDSILGAPAYLADVFRFLNEQPSEIAGETVLDQLFKRRPDLGNLKLNCDNTNVALPYIDLVNETLEALIPPADANTDHQTTLTQAELRAFPEHVRTDAYTVLKNADFPIKPTLDLWQEEARAYLEHLGVPRHELMARFQKAGPPASPTDTSIAAEYFGISSHETTLITTAKPVAADQQAFWGLNPFPDPMPVDTFLERSNLTYNELLRLLYVEWLNPVADANRSEILRPVDTNSLRAQRITNLSLDRLDRMHRFLRLWRHTSWQMWELDLLIRATSIGNGVIDGDTLVELMRVRKIQTRLGIDVETALAVLDTIPTVDREVPENPQKSTPALYAQLFQNRLITNPVDQIFALPIAGNPLLNDHRPALVAALAVSDIELTALLGRTDGNLNLANLSKLVGLSTLASGLHLRPTDLVTLLSLTGITDPFADAATTLSVLEHADAIAASGIDIAELDFLLNARPTSPYSLRDDVIAQEVSNIRESLRSNPAADARGQVVTGIAGARSLSAEVAAVLLDRLTSGGNPLIDRFFDPALTATAADGSYVNAVNAATFGPLFTGYRQLHKASRIVTRHKLIDPAELIWFLDNSAALKTLALPVIPVNVAPAQSLYPTWLALHQFLRFRDNHPAAEGASLVAVLTQAVNAAAPAGAAQAALAALTGWSLDDLNRLHTGLGFQEGAASSYTSIATYLRLEQCFEAMHRLGVSAAQPLKWADRDTDAGGAQAIAAQEIRQAAKARYTANAWFDIATPIMDDLRERKRDGLVDWLIENSLRNEPPEITVSGKQWANPKRWKEPNDLLGWLLIDVEMSSCQLTSRVKQAISSTQMFVQRCFLNLEQAFVQVSRAAQADSVTLNSWKQWKWMKNYRIWEANRKVFLYPENWIEPELRDDKSPFFEELESELLQADITDDNAAAAFRHYLEKVHEVARLDITGVYYEVDDDAPYDTLPPNINRLHVIGRTKADPAVFFYRQFDLNYGTWTAWERLDLEIGGDHVIPVVYNRTVYLFWLVFTEKPQKAKKQPAAQMSTTPQNSPEPSTQLEIQLAWSVRTDNGWTAKKLSRQKLLHPWQRPLHSYNLKPRYRSVENLLWLDLYISTSIEFNNTTFLDPYTGDRVKLTATGYDEAGRPWHSSSFIFDGAVVGTRMKGLSGQYHLKDGWGNISDNRSATDSHTWVSTTFGADGHAITRATGGRETMPRQVLPAGMHFENTRLRNNTYSANPSTVNVLEGTGSVTLLRGARAPFDLVFSQHGLQFDEAVTFPGPMIYQDPQRSFFIKPHWRTVLMGYNQTLQRLQYDFYPFYHPYSALFLRELKRSGLEGLLTRTIQTTPQVYYPGNGFQFLSYAPDPPAESHVSAKTDVVDFDLGGAYSIYNWELFFHAPLMVATKLTQNQRFEEAMKWFHFIFDPTNTDAIDSPQRFWVTAPFFNQNSEDYRKQRIENLLKDIGANLDQLRAWKNNPFKPHLIARYRPVAYQKTVVMKYIDNLFAWGDQLFRRDTIESINEATTIYLLAAEILGPRPISIPNVARADKSYNDLTAAGALDPFGNTNVTVLMENLTDSPIHVVRSDDGTEPMPVLQVQYFGLPQNSNLIAYWDLVADRLYKIRNCMNIRGIVRQLPLFEPPIDPALLVQAAAAGIDLDSVLGPQAAPASPYRTRPLLQKAVEFTQDVRALGERILAVVEKIDATALELLRATNETDLLNTVTAIKKLQIKEAESNVSAAERSKEISETKRDYYGGRDYINLWEGTALTLSGISALAQTAIALGYALAGGLTFIPRFTIGAAGFGGSPTAVADPVDGARVSKAAEYAVSTLGAIATAAEKWAGMATTMGSYQRRSEEWQFQKSVAEKEIAQIEETIKSAQFRVQMAEQELENHEFQIDQSRGVADYLKAKYSNGQLYSWMLGQASTVYFQCYQLAFDMAKRAEASMKYELGDDTLSFIQFGYWDSLKKGLLAGDLLINDLRRMESAWFERNTRSFEIVKNVSLAQIDPLALLTLKTTGSCAVTLPEWLFDLDYPGHLRRRIAAVSISIPCVVGPYTSVNCTLSMTNNGVRVKDGVAGGYGDPLAGGDDRFVIEQAPIQVIATSHAQNDSGMFELSFADERYLPFEGAGAVSQWTIDLPLANNQFDFTTISDVVLHLRYTAEAGSIPLANAARANLATVVPKAGVRMFVLNREFGTEWQRFFSPQPNTDQELLFTLERKHLPFRARGAANVKLTRLDLITSSNWANAFDVQLTLPGTAPRNETMSRIGGADQPHHLVIDPVTPPANVLGQVSMKIKKDNAADFRSLAEGDLGETYLIVGFTTS